MDLFEWTCWNNIGFSDLKKNYLALLNFGTRFDGDNYNIISNGRILECGAYIITDLIERRFEDSHLHNRHMTNKTREEKK